ncbi:MAG: hypothetical protein AB7F50_03605 [Fimbriimonadaceae bacterium]
MRFKAKDSHGNFYEATGSSIVKNRACLYNLPDFEEVYGGSSATIGFNILAGRNYELKLDVFSWPATEVAGDMYNMGVLLVHSHAGPNAHQCSPGQSDLFWDVIGHNTPHSYELQSETWNGPGLPPFNLTEVPPVHLAIIEGCDTGLGFTYQSAMLPYENVYSNGFVENQAVVGFGGKMWTPESERLVEWIMSPLVAGDSVWKAREVFAGKNLYEMEQQRP